MAGALLTATLWPTPGAPQPLERMCIICGTLGGIDFVANVVLFVPLGLALARDGFTPGKATMLGAMLSLAIEVLQWRLVPGRDSSLGDLLTNTLGTGGGALLFAWSEVLWRPAVATARRLALAWAGVVLGVTTFAAWSLRPAAPELLYFSQWTPSRGGYAPLSGGFSGLRLFGERLPNAVGVDPTDRPAAYARGELQLEGVVRDPDLMERRPVLLARLANPLGEQAQLVQRGDALVFRGRTNAARAGLRSPTFVLDRAFVSPGENVFRVTSIAGRVSLEGARRLDYRVTLGRFWHTLAPFEVQVATWDAPMAALFLAGLMAPLAFFLGRTGVVIAPAAGLVVAVLALGAVPALFGIAAGGTWEVLGATAGIGLGAVVGRREQGTTS